MPSREAPKVERETPDPVAEQADDSAALLEELQSAWFQAAEAEHALAGDLRADVKAMMSGGEIDVDAVRAKISAVTSRQAPRLPPRLRPTRQVPQAADAYPVDSAPLPTPQRIIERAPEPVIDKSRLSIDRQQVAAHIAQLEQRVAGAKAKGDDFAADSWQQDINRKKVELQQINSKLAA